MNRPGEVNIRVVFASEDVPGLEALELLVDGLSPLLKEYSRVLVGEEVDWDISKLSFSSIGLGVYPNQRTKPHLEDPLRNMSRRFVHDLTVLESGMSAETTILGSDTRLWRKWIQLVTTENIKMVEVESEGSSATLTANGAGSVDIPRLPGAVVDSVRGTIQGVNFSSGTYFTLHRESDNRPIRCYFPERMEEPVVANLRKKVSVTGKVRYDASGEYQSITVTLPPRRLRGRGDAPRIVDLVGITSGFRSDESIADSDREATSVR